MSNGEGFPAELALAGRCNFLVDGDSSVFTEQPQTINLRIEVLDLFSTPDYLSSNLHVKVAGLRRVGSAGEHLVLQIDSLIRPRLRSES